MTFALKAIKQKSDDDILDQRIAAEVTHLAFEHLECFGVRPTNKQINYWIRILRDSVKKGVVLDFSQMDSDLLELD